MPPAVLPRQLISSGCFHLLVPESVSAPAPCGRCPGLAQGWLELGAVIAAPVGMLRLELQRGQCLCLPRGVYLWGSRLVSWVRLHLLGYQQAQEQPPPAQGCCRTSRPPCRGRHRPPRQPPLARPEPGGRGLGRPRPPSSCPVHRAHAPHLPLGPGQPVPCSGVRWALTPASRAGTRARQRSRPDLPHPRPACRGPRTPSHRGRWSSALPAEPCRRAHPHPVPAAPAGPLQLAWQTRALRISCSKVSNK